MGAEISQDEAAAPSVDLHAAAAHPELSIELSGPPLAPPSSPSTPEFRVIAQGKTKRGIRLEHAFWQAAKRISRHHHTTIGGFFDAVSESDANASNLASAIRVACLNWMAERTAELEARTSLPVVTSILAAVSSPAVVLGPDRKIVAANRAFHSFARRHVGVLVSFDPKETKLATDLGVRDIIAKLEREGGGSVVTGFSLTIGDRRIRGQLTAVLAPLSEPGNIIGFVVL